MFLLGIAARGSFKRQIILTFVAGFFLLATAFTAYQVRNESLYLYRESASDTVSLAESLAASSRSWVLANDVAGLQEVIHSFQTHPGLRYAMIISPSGRVLAHSDATKIGLFVSDAASLALLKAPPGKRVMIDNATLIDIVVPIMVGSRHVGWARAGQGREGIVGNLRAVILVDTLFVLLATLLSLLAALLIANRLGARIGGLAQVADDVQAGNFSTRASIPGVKDEIGKLADSFNQMLDALARNEDRLLAASRYTRSLIEASMDPLVTISTDGKITDVNQTTEAITGKSRAELIGTDFSDYFTEPDKARAGYQQVFLDGSVTDYPLALRHRDGHVSDVLYNASVFRNQAGEVAGVFAAARDITERKRAEATRTQLAAIVESSNDAIIAKTTDGIITSWNKSAEKIYGYSADEIIGKSITTLAPPARHAEVQELLEKIRKGGTVANYETERIRKDGALIHVALTLSPIRDASGAIAGISTIARDITERKKAEFVLRQSEEALKEAQRIAHVGSWHMDLASNEVVWSEVLYNLYGFDPALPPPLYTESMKLFTPESWERLSSAIARAAETGIPYELELEMTPKDGRRGWMLARGELVRDEHGAPVRIRGVVMDITERKQAEQELLERERHAQSLLRLSRNMERSQTYAEVLNAAQDEVKTIIGYQSLWVYLISDDKQYLKALVAGGEVSDTVMSEEGTATLTIKGDRMLEEIAASKEIVLVEDARTDERVNKEIAVSMGMRTVVNIPIMLFDRHMGCVGTGSFGDEGVKVPSSSEQKYLIAMASHIAVALDRIHLLDERRKAEMTLRELNKDFVTLLESTGDYIYFKDQNSRIRFCSQTLANITGHSSWRDMIGKHDLEIFPKDTARIYYEEELPIFREGKSLLNKTDPYYDAQGKQGWVNTNKWPVFGDDKKTVVGIFGISRDITELKEAEDKINELNRDLEQRVAERTAQLEAANKELESFSYTVSHDLRAPLRAIDGFSHILQEDYTDKLDDEGKRLLNVVSDNTNRMGQLIDDILQFSRTGRLELNFSEIDMEGMARTVLEELQSVAAAKRKLQVEIEHLPSVTGDPPMMHQVFVNLLSNAIKFTGAKESAMIKVGGAVEGDEAVYYVKDNGAGFDMQYADKLFGVFRRLHGVNEFEGTGIGLAIVKRIVNRHGGRVWAEGKVNEGATIYFTLPTKEKKHE